MMPPLWATGPLLPVLEDVARRWGLRSFQPIMVDNADFCDAVLQALDDAPSVPLELRREATAALLGPGPGGLLACAWLHEQGAMDLAQLAAFVSCLPGGAARSDALSEARWMELQSRWRDLPFDCWPRLLASSALSSRARQAGLLALTRALPISVASRLAHWACRNNKHLAPEWPDAPDELCRLGFLECVRLGEPPAATLEEALGRGDDGAGQAALELVERYATEIPPVELDSALQQLRGSDASALRRRAFGLLEKLQGEHWVHEGLRDRDAAVRSWALQRLNTRGTACANSRST